MDWRFDFQHRFGQISSCQNNYIKARQSGNIFIENKILRILQYPLWIQLSIKHVFPCVYGKTISLFGFTTSSLCCVRTCRIREPYRQKSLWNKCLKSHRYHKRLSVELIGKSFTETSNQISQRSAISAIFHLLPSNFDRLFLTEFW